MDFRIRLFFESLVAMTNQFDDVPLEAKRFVIISLLSLVEQEADKAVDAQRNEIALKAMEETNAKDIQQNQLGELPFGGDADKRVEPEQDGLRNR